MTKIIKRLKKIILSKLNINSDAQFGDDSEFGENEFQVPEPSKEVIELARRFKFGNENSQNSYENETISPNLRIDENFLYDKFENFILNNSEGEKLPNNADIEKFLSISEWKRKELINVAREKGLIIRKNGTRSILNIHY